MGIEPRLRLRIGVFNRGILNGGVVVSGWTPAWVVPARHALLVGGIPDMF